MKKIIIILAIITVLAPTSVAFAHRSGCHRWHSCPSDSGSYTCGDTGHPCSYPTYPAKTGGVIYPPSGVYKDCYNCAWKTVPLSDNRVWKRTLNRGMSGTDVTYLQIALYKEGLFPNTNFTNYFGNVTANAYNKFQTIYGTAGDDWATISKLNGLYKYTK